MRGSVKCISSAILFVIGFSFSSFSQENRKIDSLNRVLESELDDSLRAQILFSISLEYADSDLREFSKTIFEAIYESSKLKDYSLKNQIFIRGGLIFYQKGLFRQSAEFFKSQLELGRQVGDKNIVGRAQFNLANVWLALEDYRLAKENMEDAFLNVGEFNKENGNKLSDRDLTLFNYSMGLANLGLNEFDSAATNFLEGISISKGKKDLIQLFNLASSNYAKTLAKKGRYDDAKQVLNELVSDNRSIGYLDGLIVNLIFLAEIEMVSGDVEEAKAALLEGWSLVNGRNSYLDKYNYSKLLGDLYRDLGKLDSALYFNDLNLIAEDSISKEKALRIILETELMDKFEVEKNKLKKNIDSIKRGSQFFYFIFILVIGVFLYFLINVSRKYFYSKKVNNIIQEEQQQLSESIQDLNSRLKIQNQELILSELKSIKSRNIIDDFESRMKEKKNNDSSFDMKSLISNLKGSLEDKSWVEFEILFKTIHEDFFEKLLSKYPNLSFNERRLCGFLRLHLTTKEIANITGQSVRAVELARTRLRKKLELTNSDQNLYDFLSNI